MREYLKRHPLATVLSVALLLRLVAVIFSKGYMASDDHFQTVHIAYRWLHDGIWGGDGLMTWQVNSSPNLSRFPLYHLLLYLNMKLMLWGGYDSLDKIMYAVRLSHGLFSLIGVAAVYKTVELATRSKNYALVAGMVMAAHFALPFLAVRNLIEMFGGTIWAAAIFYFYKYRSDRNLTWLVIAGVLSGLAWMFRFQMLLAFWIVPLILWYESRRLKPALYYGLTLMAMLLLAGFVDWLNMGTFMGTSINHVRQGLSEGALYGTSRLIYAGVIVGFFIPPASLIAVWLAFRKRFWQDHRLLAFTSLSFVVLHTALANRQERFMIPVLPALVVLFILAFHNYLRKEGMLFRWTRWRVALVAFTLVVNMALLVPFTLNYGHKGLVEPFAEINRLSDQRPRLLLFSPDKHRIYALEYSGFEMALRSYVHSWSDFSKSFGPDSGGHPFDYYLLYPLEASDLSRYVDSLSSRVGPLEPVFHLSPSVVDWVLHMLNPAHNRTNEVWVYRNARQSAAVRTSQQKRPG